MSDQTIEYDVEFRAITKRFGSLVAVNGVSLKVRKGEFLSLLGPSGCGKTTSLRMIAGFEQPDEGELLIGGFDAVGIPPVPARREHVFQSTPCSRTCRSSTTSAYGLKQKVGRKRERCARAGEALELVQLTGRDTRRPTSSPAVSSSGWRWRGRWSTSRGSSCWTSRWARSTSSSARRCRSSSPRIQEQVGITFIYVTHDQDEALSMSDRIAVMSNGVIEQLDSPGEIYDRPADRVRGRLHRRDELLEGRVAESADARLRHRCRRGRRPSRRGHRQAADRARRIRPERIRSRARQRIRHRQQRAAAEVADKRCTSATRCS